MFSRRDKKICINLIQINICWMLNYLLLIRIERVPILGDCGLQVLYPCYDIKIRFKKTYSVDIIHREQDTGSSDVSV
jgi:hypothetical protein